MRRKSGRGRGFTLVEVLVVIAIILVLAALAFLMLRRAKQAAHRATCTQNLRQIGVGIGLYLQENGRFPSQVGDPCWDRAILPSLSAESIGPFPGNAAFSRGSDEAAAVASLAEIFACPADKQERDPAYLKRSYAIVPWTTNWSNGTAFRGWKERPLRTGVPMVAVDRPSSAATVVEWHSGTEGIANNLGSGSHAYHDRGGPDDSLNEVHQGTQNVLFLDGHVERIGLISNEEFVRLYWPGTIGNLN